jgi:hypothetical protein
MEAAVADELAFEWDDRKAASNLAKHRVSFVEASTVFGDPRALTVHDPDHSDEEDRFVTVGFSDRGRLLMISHADREERIRIISARKATSREAEDFANQ